MYEIEPLVSNIHKRNKESWEQTRFISYIIAQVNSTKKLKPTDILSFNWDEMKDDQQSETVITNDEIKRLKEKADQYLKTQTT